MELSVGGWFSLAVASGLAAGIMNNLTSLLTARFERAARQKERVEERTHASLLRREAAHENARDRFLPKAEEVAEWAEEQAYEQFFEEVGDPILRPPTARKGISSEAEALDALRQIKYGHPTKEVRDYAKKLFADVASVFSEFSPDGAQAWPLTLDKANQWSKDAQRLVEQIHTTETSGDPLGQQSR